MSNYVLVADSNGDIEILQVAYETKWKDLSVMLQIKFDYESTPVFTYTDDEDDVVCLDSQDALDEALKVCKRNDDVMHVQIRRCGVPLPQVRRISASQKDAPTPLFTKDHIENARAAVGNTIDWAKTAVKSAFSRNTSIDAVSAEACKEEPQMNSLEMATIKEPELQEPEPLLHEIDHESCDTSVKGVLDSECDISVPTSAITDGESDIVVKEPISPTTEEPNTREIDPVMLRSIKEEVRLAITQELQTFRNEVSAGLTQSMIAKQNDDEDVSSSSRDAGDHSRSPTDIRADIRKLKLEMKEAKQLRKAKKQHEKALRKRSREIPTVSPTCDPGAETKKARKYAASFICENLLDGSIIGVQQQFVKYWVLKNEGTVTWDDQIQLRLIEEQVSDDSSSVDPKPESEPKINPFRLEQRWGAEKVSIGMPIVESGNTAVLAVTHLAPPMPCIYTSAWRLCHGEKYFGPRIWCKVIVKEEMEINVESSGEDDEFSLSLTKQEPSYASRQFEPSRKISTDEPMNADDDISNMLSFEMTAVADFNKENSVEHHHSNNFNFNVSPPRSLATTEKTAEITEAEVAEVQNIAEPVSEPEERMNGTENEVDDEQADVLDEPEPEKTNLEPEELVLDEHPTDSKAHSVPPEDIPEDLESECVPEQNPEVLDVASQGEEVHDIDDTHSDVASDFEVIPLPECFDTSKPLNSFEKEEEANAQTESMLSHHSTASAPAQEVEELQDSPPSFTEAQAEEISEDPMEEHEVLDETFTDMEEDSNDEQSEDRDVMVAEVVSEIEHEDSPTEVASHTSISSNADKSVAPSCLPVPQSVLDIDKPAPSTVVQDYSVGYPTPVQKTAPPQEPWVSQPIPLPRGVLDADKPWVKNESKSTPLPHPRSGNDLHGLEQKSSYTYEQTALTETPAVEVLEDEDTPVICFPPQQQVDLVPEAEDGDEFTLAPETPTNSPTLPILVPPGYPVPPPTLPSTVVGPSAPANNAVSPRPPPATVSSDSQNVDAYNASPMEQLIDMGFLNIELNEDLLHQFSGDLSKVVNALIYRGSENAAHHQRRSQRRGFGFGSFLA